MAIIEYFLNTTADTTPDMAANNEQEIKQIPEPPGLPLIGNINDLDRSFPLGSFLRLSEQYGGC